MAIRDPNTILVTGGAGFIGSNLIHYLFSRSDFSGTVVNADLLTYAGNLSNVDSISKEFTESRYVFERIDIRDAAAVRSLFDKYPVDAVIHLAAESHVDRSIHGPGDFVTTNIVGTFNLLEASRAAWEDRTDVLLHHVSTDEVFGSLGAEGKFSENSPYNPRSPYSASKASSDHLVRAYHHTYGLPVTVSNCSNNYGPYQFPEKLIPLMIINMLNGRSLPVYGDGSNVRDWLYVQDHASAIWKIILNGESGETFNVGGNSEWTNIDLIHHLCEIVSDTTGRNEEDLKDLITFVNDRPGHDMRYAIDSSKIEKDLGWKRNNTFADGLRKTVEWYLENPEWIENVQTGEYRNWIEKNYGKP